MKKEINDVWKQIKLFGDILCVRVLQQAALSRRQEVIKACPKPMKHLVY